MGKINAGILGGVSGKVGPVVGGSWKGINYLRQMPASVANPRTAGQVEQRNKFKGAVGYAVLLLAVIIKPLWDRFVVKQSGYNEWVSKNLFNFDEEGDPIGNDEFILSSGKLPGVTSLAAVSAGTNVTVTWVANSGGLALNTDEVYIVIMGPEYQIQTQVKTGASRATQSAVIANMPSSTANLAVYIMLRRVDGTAVSTSQSVLSTI